jgi:uncharacterized protein YeaO (DUF488 family)
VSGPDIILARVYDPPADDGRARLLVDRLWPRGVARSKLPLDGWLRDLTPSAELRRWFHRDKVGRWAEFQRRYRAELDALPQDTLAPALQLCCRGPVTLLYAGHDPDLAHATVLRAFLIEACTSGGPD